MLAKCKCGRYTDFGLMCSFCRISLQFETVPEFHKKKKDEEEEDELIEEELDYEET